MGTMETIHVHVYTCEITRPVWRHGSVLQGTPVEIWRVPETYVTVRIPCNVVTTQVNGLVHVIISKIIVGVCRRHPHREITMVMYMYILQFMHMQTSCMYIHCMRHTIMYMYKLMCMVIHVCRGTHIAFVLCMYIRCIRTNAYVLSANSPLNQLLAIRPHGTTGNL